MNLVDSSGWIEFFTDGRLASKYLNYLEKIEEIIVPTLVIYEVYRKIKKERSEEEAILAAAYMGRGKIINLDDSLAMSAADVSIRYNLSMADAVIYASVVQEGAKLITSDAHFSRLENVVLLRK